MSLPELSNPRQMIVDEVPIGAYLSTNDGDFKIKGIREDKDDVVMFILDRDRNNGKRYFYAYRRSTVTVRFETINNGR